MKQDITGTIQNPVSQSFRNPFDYTDARALPSVPRHVPNPIWANFVLYRPILKIAQT